MIVSGSLCKMDQVGNVYTTNSPNPVMCKLLLHDVPVAGTLKEAKALAASNRRTREYRRMIHDLILNR